MNCCKQGIEKAIFLKIYMQMYVIHLITLSLRPRKCALEITRLTKQSCIRCLNASNLNSCLQPIVWRLARRIHLCPLCGSLTHDEVTSPGRLMKSVADVCVCVRKRY